MTDKQIIIDGVDVSGCINYEEYYEEDEDEDIIDVESDNIEVQQVNKQEVMDRLFEEYRHGDITEDELNERLKKLWWKEND